MNAERFVRTWQNRGYEKGETHKFWLQFLRDVLDFDSPESIIDFELPVVLRKYNYIDAFLDDTKVIIEQKSLGRDIVSAYEQAQRYGSNLPYSKRPRWIITSNFAEFYIYDMETHAAPVKISLAELPAKRHAFEILIDRNKKSAAHKEEMSVRAGVCVKKLFELLRNKYADKTSTSTLHSLSKLCTRIVFCLYAENAKVFKPKIFTNYLASFSDRNSFRDALRNLFSTLNTPIHQRSEFISDQLKDFPYADGGLFDDDPFDFPDFSAAARDVFFNEICSFPWEEISPPIFGSVFEATLNPDDNKDIRRESGIRYTSTKNIDRLIDTLFMDELNDRFDAATTRADLVSLHNTLAQIKIFDPACGSGNFLTQSYIRLRELENRIIDALVNKEGVHFDSLDAAITVSIHNFFGIEINDFAVNVARTALWISEIQTRINTAKILRLEASHFPLKVNNNIHCANALTLDWRSVISPADCTYIISNPPFIGASNMSATQKSDAVKIFGRIKLSNSIDYVGAWYHLAASFIQGTKIRAAFVSTNSITQGEQVAPLWHKIFAAGCHIDFAFRTFKWDNEFLTEIKRLKNARKTALNRNADKETDKGFKGAFVHCVMISFSHAVNLRRRFIFDGDRDFESVRDKYRKAAAAHNINAYLVDAPNTLIESRTSPLCPVPKMTNGNQPSDGGNFIFSEEEAAAFTKKYPQQAHLLRRYIGARDFIHGKPVRYCLWLKDVPPNEYAGNREIHRRLEAIRNFRLASTAAPTRDSASYPYKFFSATQGNETCIVIPRVSSERRKYIPIGFVEPEIIVGDALTIIPSAEIYHFGVLTSSVHMAWVKVVAGRLESRYRYSGSVVYNNFPWCESTAAARAKIEGTAQGILDVLARYPESTLADLYDDLTMPEDLRAAHLANDRAVMEAYGFDLNMTEAGVVAELFRLWQALAGELSPPPHGGS